MNASQNLGVLSHSKLLGAVPVSAASLRLPQLAHTSLSASSNATLLTVPSRSYWRHMPQMFMLRSMSNLVKVTPVTVGCSTLTTPHGMLWTKM